MNEVAANRDTDFDTFLRAQLAFRDGREEQFSSETTIDWISDGGEYEDAWRPLPGRFNSHFHDPLRAWTSAGLGHWAFDSSVIWMQELQGWSWQEARDFFYTALTSSDPADRDLNWTKTFRAMGQIMHLIEDAGQPGHVRNDQHMGGFICHAVGLSCYGNFEYWSENNASKLPLTGGEDFDHAILYQTTPYSQAPVPVARLIDNEVYDGSFAVFGPSIGIAEFTNSNFFSEDTVNLDYPHPDVTRLVPTTWTVPGTGELRQYWAKGDGDGVPVDPVAIGSVLSNYVASPLYSTDDDRVWEAIAQYVGPKAVDYAQGALDYFFRGRLDFTHDPQNPTNYLIVNNGPAPNAQPETMNGTFALYSEDGAGTRTPAANGTWDRAIDAGATASVPPFTTSPTAVRYVLAFSGSLGFEMPVNANDVGAVAVADQDIRVRALGYGLDSGPQWPPFAAAIIGLEPAVYGFNVRWERPLLRKWRNERRPNLAGVEIKRRRNNLH